MTFTLDQTQLCPNCGEQRDIREFRIRSDTGKRRNVCNPCRVAQITVWQKNNIAQTRRNQRAYNHSVRGRAIILLNAASARARLKNEPFALRAENVIAGLLPGLCCKTFVPFDYHNAFGGTQSPFAPSIDKIDPAGIYEPTNVQYVCWWYNLAKQQWDETLLIQMCKRVAAINA